MSVLSSLKQRLICFILVCVVFTSFNVLANKESKTTKEQASIVDTLYLDGKKLFHQKELEPAQKKFETAIKIEKKKKVPSNKKLCVLYFWLGRIFINKKDAGTAVKTLEMALAYYDKNDFNDLYPAQLFEELSIAYQMSGKYKKGLKFALLSFDQHKEKYGNNDLWTGVSATGVAVLYHKCSNTPKAIEYLQKAINIFNKFPKKKKETERLNKTLNEWSKSQ
jgi:tetratricopeptide (TPR) repeat protein